MTRNEHPPIGMVSAIPCSTLPVTPPLNPVPSLPAWIKPHLCRMVKEAKLQMAMLGLHELVAPRPDASAEQCASIAAGSTPAR
jgi:hypothetical protein